MSNIHARLPRWLAPPDRPTTRDMLLQRMTAERATWDQMVARVPDTLLARAVLPDGWSIKDLIAHIAAYEQWTFAQVAAASAGQSPTAQDLYGVDALPAAAASWSVDAQNAYIRSLYTEMPAPEVIVFAARAFAGLAGAVAALTEDDLCRPGAQAWTGAATLLEVIPAQTFEHYQLHRPDLEAVLAVVAPRPLAGAGHRSA